MADDLQQITGIGPAREENIIEAGYESFEDLATADREHLSESVNRLPEDTALDIMVQAENLVEDAQERETEMTTEENEDEDIGVTHSIDVSDGADTETDSVDESETTTTEAEPVEDYTVTITPETEHEYDALYDALLQYRQKLISTNRTGIDHVTTLLAEVRTGSVDDEVRFTLTGSELNQLHSAVKQHRLHYQSKNLNEQLDALRRIEVKINQEREKYLF